MARVFQFMEGEGYPTKTIQYYSSGGASAGNAVNIVGVGPAIIGAGDIAAAGTGTAFVAGRFRGPLGSGETVTQGDKLYYDVSGKVLWKFGDDTIVPGTDFFIGMAAETQATAGGQVQFDLGVKPNDQTAASLASVYGATPVAQASVVAQLDTTVATSTSTWPFTSTQAVALQSAVNSILTCVKNYGPMAKA